MKTTMRNICIPAALALALILSFHTTGMANELMDNSITAKVQDQLSHRDDISVSTAGGIVTLTGNVPNVQEKNRLLRETRRVPGVAGIRDMIAVEDTRSEQVVRDRTSYGRTAASSGRRVDYTNANIDHSDRDPRSTSWRHTHREPRRPATEKEWEDALMGLNPKAIRIN